MLPWKMIKQLNIAGVREPMTVRCGTVQLNKPQSSLPACGVEARISLCGIPDRDVDPFGLDWVGK